MANFHRESVWIKEPAGLIDRDASERSLTPGEFRSYNTSRTPTTGARPGLGRSRRAKIGAFEANPRIFTGGDTRIAKSIARAVPGRKRGQAPAEYSRSQSPFPSSQGLCNPPAGGDATLDGSPI